MKKSLKKYIIYVDGFNLYYNIKKTNYKWLNLKLLIKSFNFQNCHISKIRYFTANVINKPNDPNIKTRQDFYLRALNTIPELEVHFGQFKRREILGELLEKNNTMYKKKVKVAKFEEKGSDVNIATFMLADCLLDECQVPVLVSNDSDLSNALKIIKEKTKKPIGLVTPDTFFVTELKKYSTFRRKITEDHLRRSLFPKRLKDNKGTFLCPKRWQ